jgi:hypothetical protein
MDLDNIINRRLSRPPKRKQKKKPEQVFKDNIRYTLKLIKTGELTMDKTSHKILLQRAIKFGFVDKDLNILKEI